LAVDDESASIDVTAAVDLLLLFLLLLLGEDTDVD